MTWPTTAICGFDDSSIKSNGERVTDLDTCTKARMTFGKKKMQRLCGQKTASCFQRCVGMDAFNAEFSTTYEIDKKHGTEYHKRFVDFLKRFSQKIGQ
jgi:aromatic ring hydroxylase